MSSRKPPKCGATKKSQWTAVSAPIGNRDVEHDVGTRPLEGRREVRADMSRGQPEGLGLPLRGREVEVDQSHDVEIVDPGAGFEPSPAHQTATDQCRFHAGASRSAGLSRSHLASVNVYEGGRIV